MDFSNEGGSVYHRLLAIYLRSPDGDIIRSVGQQSKTFEVIWSSVGTKVLEASKASPTPEVIIPNVTIERDDGDNSDVRTVGIIERPESESSDIIGIVILVPNDCSDMSEFTKMFAKLMISRSTLSVAEPSISDEMEVITQRLTDLFDSYLRFEGRNDKWKEGGRDYFVERVRFYVSKNTKIDACLPAFPCKSSNTEKVSGENPDKGEELALRRLHGFVQEVEKIYPPGACIWIISDGHVFSDCSKLDSPPSDSATEPNKRTVGVDDTTVDVYGERLQEMNQKIAEELGSDERICFRSLPDIFDLQSFVGDVEQIEQDVDVPDVDHHIETEHTKDAEVSRQILMAGCAPNPDVLRQRIKSGEKSIVALYRGFSRFMLEDLELHPSTDDLSKSKRKKLAEKVSFEMIQRNQAYSNLIEMIFPDHLRLSIHAHDNAGPKFGIQLFDETKVKATDDLQPESLKASSDDLLHIPTPWHNSVAQVEGHPTIYVTKSKVVEEVLDAKVYEGGFVDGELDEGKGGLFVLSDLTGTITKDQPEENTVAADSLSASVDSLASSTPSQNSVLEELAPTPTTVSETDASSVETSPDVGPQKPTEAIEAMRTKTDVVKEEELIAATGTDTSNDLSMNEVLNLVQLKQMGLDSQMIQELREITMQWVEARLGSRTAPIAVA